jgi:polysaccharide export outer membrane protein
MKFIEKGGRRGFRLEVLLVAAGLFWLAACGGTGGPVVKITDVQKDAGPILEKGLYEGLRRDDVARIEELKRTLSQKEKEPGDATVEEIVGKTPSFSVGEYVAKYPESRTIGEDYKIGGYDVLSITVYGEKDLSMESIRVSADGSLSFPLIGRINVADLSTAEVEKLIARKLAEGQFLLDAHVSVLVTKYESRKFAVLGAVKSPGHYPLQAREKVLDGLSKASGLAGESDSQGRPIAGEAQEGMIIRTLNAGLRDERKIVITFDLQGLLKGRDQTSNIYLADRDVIFIPKADFFYIIGEVKTPGSYAFPKKDLTIVEAISMAGGFTRIAARNKTRIVRIEDGAERIYDVNVDAITKAGRMIQAVPIKPNDLIVIPESFF